ncbi:helix-turn-helix domain-containing protein [Paenisporosarcina sp. NPDC076898]|uniref:helix-turn-helix domain-containing protein n=1 Tax=unclassified Paenisporosarcina TaxID=2642018 RepID=UPI003CFFD289
MTANETDIYLKIGKALKEIRTEKKLTLQQIEKISKLHAANISLAENGKSNPSIGWIVHYCNVLDINPNEVFIRAFAEDFKYQQLDRILDRFTAYQLEKTTPENE